MKLNQEHIRKSILSLAGIVVFIGLAGAQPSNVAFRNFTSAEGLPNTSVADVSQDALGFIWIATWEGVYRFDGKKYERITDEDSRELAADKNGGMWMSYTRMGTIGYYNIYADSIKNYFLGEGIRSPDICLDGNGDVWIGGPTGILKLDTAADTFLVDNPQLPGEAMYLTARGNGEIVFITRDPENSRFSMGFRKPDGKYVLQDFPIDLNNPDKGKRFNESYPPFGMGFYGDSGLVIINRYGWAIKDNMEAEWDFRKPADQHLIEHFRGDLIGRDNMAWLNQGNGLCRIDLESGSVTTYLHDPVNNHSILPYSNLGAGGNIFLDRHGILWITRYGQGISSLNLYESDFGLARDGEGKPIIDVLSAVELEDGSFFIGSRTIKDGLYHFDKDGNLVTRYGSSSFDAPAGRSVSTELSHPFVWSLVRGHDGSVWAGTGWPRVGQGGLNRIRPGSKEITRFKMDPENEHSLPDDWVVFVLEDGSGRIWASTVRNGWCRVDPVTELVSRGFNDENAFGDISEFSYGFITNEGDLVFENGYNYFQVDHKNLAISPFAPKIKPQEPFHYVLQDDLGRYWFVSQNGFGFVDELLENVGLYYNFREQNFPADQVSTISVDDKGYAWLATNNGIVRFEPGSGTYNHYGYNRGLQSNYFRGMLNHVGPSGKIYFAGNAGINIIDPGKITTNPNPPDMLFTGLELDGIPAEPGEGSAILKSINIAEKVVIGPEVSVISIDFAAIHFAGENENHYQFKMEGFDRDWRDGGTVGNATYTNLSNGRYTFRIRGSNWDGVWSDGSKSIEIIILPPWWKTWWAYSMYAVLLIIGIFLFDRYRKGWLLEKEREKTRERELAQAREIEKAYEELKATQKQLIHSEKMASLGELTAGIAHEIQNPLNFVNNFSEVNKELAAELREEIKNGHLEEADAISADIIQNEEKINFHGKRADAIVKSMLQHSRSSNGDKVPTDINALADEYLRLSYHGLRAKDKSFNAEFRLEADKDLPKATVVPQDLGRVFLNLINNAFYAVAEKAKHAPGEYRPEVVVSTKQTINNIEVRIVDNGDGIPDNIKEKIFQPFFTTKPTGVGTGLGLSLSYDIITKGHGGELKVNTTTGKGTEFIISIPNRS